MFNTINRFAAILAMLLFSYAQFQGWSPFDNDAQSHGSSHGSSGSSRTYHK